MENIFRTLEVGLVILTFAAPVCAESPAPANLESPAGMVLTKIGVARDSAYAVGTQADGKIVVAGTSFGGGSENLTVVRYLPRGGLDRAFGDRGSVVISFRQGPAKAYSILCASDGKILVAGTAFNGKNGDFALARLNADGSFDTSFNDIGKVLVDFGEGDDAAYSVAIQKDGKIVAAGSSAWDHHESFGVARLNDNGTLDSSFGIKGKAHFNFGSNREARAYAVAVRGDNKIVVSGFVLAGETSYVALARLMSEGGLDPTFGKAGKVLDSPGRNGNDKAYAMVLGEDDNILLGGSSSNGRSSEFMLARYLENGKPDPSFGMDGVAMAAIGTSCDTIYGLTLLSDGKIIAVGSSFDGSDFSFALARFAQTGVLDRTYGSNGIVAKSLGSGYASFYGLALQADGKPIVVGVAYGDGGYLYALARLDRNGKFDASFGQSSDDSVYARTKDAGLGMAGFGPAVDTILSP